VNVRLTGSRPSFRSAQLVTLYLAVWIGYFALLWLLPVRYGRLESSTTAMSLALWVFVSTVVAYGVHALVGGTSVSVNAARQYVGGRPIEPFQISRIVCIGMILSAAGFASLLFDRIVLQGIDYSQGLAVARELWRQSGEARNQVSSIFSVLGYLIGFSFFCSIALAHLHWEVIGKAVRRIVIYGGIVLVMANSILLGGRSIVLVQLAAIVAIAGIRRTLGLSAFPARGGRVFLIGGAVFLLALAYSIYIFGDRAAAGSTLPSVYSVSALEFLGGEPTDAFYTLDKLPEVLANTAELGTLAGAYLTHSFGTFESILEYSSTPGSVTFVFVRTMLARLGAIPEATEVLTLDGRFLSLPGSLWYDYGWYGFYAGAAVIGVLIGLIPVVLSWRRSGGIALAVAITILLTGLLAPLLMAVDILCVPFMIVGFVLLDLINRALGGGVNWVVVGRRVWISTDQIAPAASAGQPEP
jgi:hypothetical protein